MYRTALKNRVAYEIYIKFLLWPANLHHIIKSLVFFMSSLPLSQGFRSLFRYYMILVVVVFGEFKKNFRESIWQKNTKVLGGKYQSFCFCSATIYTRPIINYKGLLINNIITLVVNSYLIV